MTEDGQHKRAPPAKALDMEWDGLAHELGNLLDAVAGCDAAGKIGSVRGLGVVLSFDDDEVTGGHDDRSWRPA